MDDDGANRWLSTIIIERVNHDSHYHHDATIEQGNHHCGLVTIVDDPSSHSSQLWIVDDHISLLLVMVLCNGDCIIIDYTGHG